MKRITGNPSEWQDRKVLVTGAGGFIGSHLVERLVSLGATVRGFVRYNSRNEPGLLRDLAPHDLAQVQVIPGDLRDLTALQAAARGCDTIFHLGALIAIPYSYDHPEDVVETNVMGTLNVLMAAREAGIRRLVHTSSSEVYGTALRVPIDEDHPLQGQSPYSASKIGADKLAESFYRSYNLPVVTLRPFNTYGPRQSERAVIPTIMTQALTQDVIHLGNLDAIRDFTYVSDVVDGFLQVAIAPGVEGQTINLGTGQAIRVADLAEMIITLAGRRVEIISEAQRLRPEKSEVMRLISDNRLALERLGWSPSVTLDEGLRLTLDWVKSHLARYSPERYVK